jgi:hypothetical protein
MPISVKSRDSNFDAADTLLLGAENTAVKTSTDGERRANRLRSEIAQLEARYDGLFPPGVYSILESLKLELIALNKTV